MTEACDFIPMLASAAKSWQEIKLLVHRAYGEKNMSYNIINSLIKAVKDIYKINQNVETESLMVAVSATV
jgi:hypothetical protein